MGMTGPGMAAYIKVRIEALSNYESAGQNPVFLDDRGLQAMCDGIVQYIKDAAVGVQGLDSNNDTEAPVSIT